MYRLEQKRCMTIVRSAPVPDALCNFDSRNQLNQISSYIDATTVYGNSDERVNTLRDPSSSIGELLVGRNEAGIDILPHQHQKLDSNTKPFACPMSGQAHGRPCLMAGDVRINENAGLASTHMLFMREHNRIAKKLAILNPHWDGNRIFNETRLIVIAMHQHINYNEYLPALLGPDVMKRYDLYPTSVGYYFGYDGTYDATISNEFTTAALRFGHAMVKDNLSRLMPNWQKAGDSLRMKETLWHPFTLYKSDQMEQLMRGLVNDSSLLGTTSFSQDMHHFLFAKHGTGKFGKDLFAINIERGRDHGLRPYNDYREYCGLRRAKSFYELLEIPSNLRYKMAQIYEHVDDIDLYVGAMAETHLAGATVGPTFACILAEQFRDLKRGDRFYYENGGCEQVFTPAQLEAIKKGVSLSRLMCNCAYGTKSMPRNAFLHGEPKIPCSSIDELDLTAWKQPFPHVGGDKLRIPDTGVWTRWFPETKSGRLDLKSIYKERPEETCLNTLNADHRRVNGKWQIRFLCPAGTIHATDVPNLPSTGGEDPIWTVWFDKNTPSESENYDDIESLTDLKSERPGQMCDNPLAIQAQTIDGVYARETGDVFYTLNEREGLICRGQDQLNRKCHDYRVRYLCPGDELEDGIEIDGKFKHAVKHQFGQAVWSGWVSNSNSNYGGDTEYIAEAVRKGAPGFCTSDKVVGFEARTVLNKLKPSQTGDIFRHFGIKQGLVCFDNDQGPGKLCSNYEIRVLCSIEEVNQDTWLTRADALQQAKKLCDSYSMCC